MSTLFNRNAMALLATVSLLVGGSATKAAPIQWTVENGGNGHYYDLVFPTGNQGTAFTWFEARAAAESMTFLGSTGHLVTVTSAQENEFLRQNFESMLAPDLRFIGGRRGDFAWIGLTDAVSEGNYQWVTGEPFSYSNWAPPEPNNLQDEDYVHYWRRDYGDGAGPRWSWNDSDPSVGAAIAPERWGFFVEFDGPFAAVPEPSTFALFGLGTVGLILFFQLQRKRFGRVG